MNVLERVRLMNEFLSRSQEEKSKLWQQNIKICLICKMKKEAWNDEIYFCEKCSEIYTQLKESNFS